MRRCTRWCLAVMAATTWTSMSLGQATQSKDKTNTNETLQKLREATSNSPLMWDIQTVIDGYVKHMTRYYDLTEKQEAYTRELLTQRVKQFLKDYEKDARALFGEYYEYQVRGELPSADAAKEFARRALPLSGAIRQEIMDGNMQWRRILNDDQKKKHDQDLKLMEMEFERYDQMMHRWSEGNVAPIDVGIRNQRTASTVNPEDAMTLYVRSFISRYTLDKGQQETAQSILREAREEVTRYRETHKAQFDSIAAQQKALTGSNPKDPEELKRIQTEGRKLTARKADLEKPLTEEIFSRLKTKLDDIPTSDQKSAYKAKQEALLAKFRSTTRPAGPTTRPAAEAAATAPATSAPVGIH